MKKFLKAIKGILTDNLLFKLGSLVFAFLVWLAVVNINDPEMTRTINNIPISVTDEDALTKQNLDYSLEGDKLAQITVTGKRSKVSKLSTSDFIAIAPLSEMSKVNAVPVYVEFKNPSYQNTVIINQRTKTIKVIVENVITKQYNIEVNMEGKPFSGYEVGETKVGRETVDITGRASILNRINKVCVDVDVNDAVKDIDGKFDIVLYQADGTTIDRSLVRMSSQRTKVKIEILLKKEILVNYKINGEPEKDYTITEVEASSSTVTICGKPEEVEKVEQINIPDDIINVKGMIKTATFTVDLDKFLPDGVSVFNNEDRNFVVKVTIEKMLTKRYELNMENLAINNVPEGYQAAILSSSISVSIKALQELQNIFDINKVTYFVDLTGAKEGIADYKISFVLRDEYEVTEEVTARVKVYKVDSEDESESTTEKFTENNTR